MGWALEHLGPSRCREIAEGLIRVEKVYGSKLHGFCPVHGDQKSASAFYNFERDSGGCQSCGEKWDLVKLWCLCQGLSGDDIKAFRAEFDEDRVGSERTNKTKRAYQPKPETPAAPEVFIDEAVYEALPLLPDELQADLTQARGWSPAVMERLGLRLFSDPKGRGRIAIPIRDHEGHLGNIRLYQRGASQFKVISWYDQVCPVCGSAWKITNKKKSCQAEGCSGAPRDFGRTRLFPAPSQWRSGVVWLCEGEPDTICALSMGLNAVTQTAGCGTWSEEFSAALAGRDVVLCYDADQAGHKGALKTADSLVKVAKSVRVVVWPEMMQAGVE